MASSAMSESDLPIIAGQASLKTKGVNPKGPVNKFKKVPAVEPCLVHKSATSVRQNNGGGNSNPTHQDVSRQENTLGVIPAANAKPKTLATTKPSGKAKAQDSANQA